MVDTSVEKQPVTHFRKDYRPPDHWIDSVALDFLVGEEGTVVRARMAVRRNEDTNDGSRPLRLVGEQLELRSVHVDGVERVVGTYELDGDELVVHEVPDRFVLDTEVMIHPESNTALTGLYASSGNLCTQCEAHGFRRITYFLDRPDVMARYTTRIEADKARYPVLLSNGNRVDSGELPGGRHWVRWEDPFLKPCYLFALVAGDLVCHRGDFTTRSGRSVPLEIWVERQNLDKCEHALRSLRKAMTWDEEVFGLEVDLDLYMIFVADDFNMGAMENKGLNVFNSKYVLASPDTATDDDYEGIEGVIAHEYFHNWTGNRVTCRDWFQLTLKEGLTVFRDQRFSADMTSAPVKRIQEVRVLRTAQFAEDAGPMAHPIRPDSYIEMNNFYTVTVYNKGAEIIRIYHTLLGVDGFRKGMDLYFERHDGHAVTCVDFRRAMADANGVDLEQMERWYSQAGTPRVTVEGDYDEAARTYRLTFRQETRRVADGVGPEPVLIPVRVGLLGEDGADMAVGLEGEAGVATSRVLRFDREEQTFAFTGVPERPVPSVFRDFSAPVEVEMDRSPEDLAFLMAHDSDAFNRWDAGQELARERLLALAADHAAGRELRVDARFVEAFGRVLDDPDLDGSLKSMALTLPSETLLGQSMDVVDPDALHAAREFLVLELARALRAPLLDVYRANAPTGPYTIDKRSIDRRRIRNRALAYLSLLDDDEVRGLAARQFAEADNMTEYEAAFACLLMNEGAERDASVEAFFKRWKHEPLVLDKWFRIQATVSRPWTFERVLELSEHPDFTLKNPNRARSLVGAFAAANQWCFHRADGRAYRFHADRVLELDAINPQVASRFVSSFNQWRRFDDGRRAAMKAELERIAEHPGLSSDVAEIVGRALAD